MWKGEIAERGECEQVTGDPQHLYTKRLLMLTPVAEPDRQAARREERRATLGSGEIAGGELTTA